MEYFMRGAAVASSATLYVCVRARARVYIVYQWAAWLLRTVAKSADVRGIFNLSEKKNAKKKWMLSSEKRRNV